MERAGFVVLLLAAISLSAIRGCVSSPTNADRGGTPTTAALDSSPRPPSHAENDCFEPTGLLPGVTSKSQVAALWGEPDEISQFGGEDASWWFGLPGQQKGITVLFRGGKVAQVWLPVSNCTLGDVVDTLGPPETIEIITQNNQPGPPVYPTKSLHYPSRGLAFRIPCPSGTSEATACASSSPTDSIKERWLYPRTTVDSIVSQASPFSTFVAWNGFDE
jgi:hypothetical protein